MNQSNPIKICFKGFIEAWEQRKLGELAATFGYGLNAAAKSFDGRHKYIRITDIDESTRRFLCSSLTSPDIDFEEAAPYRLAEGDVLFARTGASVGKSYRYVRTDGEVYFAGFLIRFRFKDKEAAEFVFQNSLTAKFQNFIKTSSQRSGQPGINAQQFSGYQIAVPNSEERERIGSFFSRLDTAITLHQSKLSKFQMLEATLLLKMFPKHGGTKPEIRFASFNNEWRLHKFEDLFSEYAIKGFDQYSALSVVQGAGTIERDRSNRNLSYSTKNLGNYKVVYKDDFILHLRSFEGGLERANSTGLVSPAYHVFHSRKVNSSFIYRIFRSSNFINRLLSPCVYGIRDGKSVDVSELKKVLLTVPDISEQRKLGYLFDLIDKVISLHQRKADLLKQIKSSLLQSMFPPSNAE